MSKHDHGVCVVFMLVCGIANLAISMENNDSRLLHIPKKEFVRVMSEIVSGTGNVDGGENENEGEESESADIIYTLNERQQLEEEPASVSFTQFGASRFSGKRKSLVPDSPRTLATKQAQLFQESSSGKSSPQTSQLDRNKPSERITTLTARSFTNRSGNVLTQRVVSQTTITSRIQKGRIKSDSLYFLQKSMEERETALKGSESNIAKRGKSKLLYGKEDFFSSDTDTAISGGKAV